VYSVINGSGVAVTGLYNWVLKTCVFRFYKKKLKREKSKF